MKTTLKLSLLAAFTLSSGIAHAGGLDRSAFSSSLLFEEGNVFTMGLSYVDPSVSGVFAGVAPTGDMADPYTMMSFGYKYDINDQLSYALQIDTPYGASVNYQDTSPVIGTTADLSSYRMSMLLRYNFTDRVSIFGGALVEQINASSATIPAAGYNLTTQSSLGYGYAVGAAYQIPEYALRIALTYQSSISHDMDIVENGVLASTVSYETPQAVTLDFQTGLNEKTLLFGSVRWAEWSSFEFAPPAYTFNLGSPLISFGNDTMTYTLGMGRKINENFSILGSVSHEASNGGSVSLLAPTDGSTTISLGAQYEQGNSKFRFGGSYSWLGDASGSFPASFEFKDNTAYGLGISFTQSF